ncbi:uncharacterized protein STEHIDRAFT_144522 [Stereum hirsutum FP-91666 SS1]|uniref:uncharacterized protein n=1 Tax=Stereum hirsutum (strain FP-91666) TaxID=721885 RepID=UPI000440EB94|nr:uncharacterized protein STEHIDRAFT_144522 [Stereum hirsutum FP-91666 SS1]EIM91095.1 hypothetical protein STEHIDRAFT_144522 [Stereum hirsutum FP-91666 SS1]
MALISTMLGFSAFGVATRCWALGIQHRPIYDWPLGHVLVGLTFGGLGYGAHQWDIRASEILAEKRAEIAARRQRQIERIEAQGQAVLAEHAQHS